MYFTYFPLTFCHLFAICCHPSVCRFSIVCVSSVYLLRRL